MKKIFALLLLSGWVLSVSAYDFTAADVKGNTIYYAYLGGDSVEVTYKDNNFNSYKGDIVIPSTVNDGTSYFQVKRIGIYAFHHCVDLNSVEIPMSVTSILVSAFSECYSLASFEVDADNPNYCSIDSVLFSKDQTVLVQCPAAKQGDYPIPNTVTSIGYSAFEYCSNLISIFIGSNVSEIGASSFFSCIKLNSIGVDSSNPNFCSVNGVLFNKDCTILRAFPCAIEGKYVIPNGVVCIDGYAFNYSKLTDITIPKSVTSIKSSAFYSCSRLNSIILPDNLTELETGAFISCSNLKSINIPDKIVEIPSLTFGYCSSLQSVDLPKNISTIGDQAFYGSSRLDTVICRRKTPPVIGTDAFKNISETAVLYVPYDSIYEYQSISEYADHFAEIKGFSDVDDITETTATLKWIPDTTVMQYNINIYTADTLFAHYVVDGDGNITSSQRFAPSIYHQKLDTTTSSTDYFVITLNGLSAGTDYDYTIDGTDAQSSPVYHEEGTFTTLNEDEEGFFDAIADDPRKQARKILRDGQWYILHNDRIYNLNGTEMK